MDGLGSMLPKLAWHLCPVVSCFSDQLPCCPALSCTGMHFLQWQCNHLIPKVSRGQVVVTVHHVQKLTYSIHMVEFYFHSWDAFFLTTVIVVTAIRRLPPWFGRICSAVNCGWLYWVHIRTLSSDTCHWWWHKLCSTCSVSSIIPPEISH